MDIKKKIKSCLVAILSFVMVFTAIPFTAHADDIGGNTGISGSDIFNVEWVLGVGDRGQPVLRMHLVSGEYEYWGKECRIESGPNAGKLHSQYASYAPLSSGGSTLKGWLNELANNPQFSNIDFIRYSALDFDPSLSTGIDFNRDSGCYAAWTDAIIGSEYEIEDASPGQVAVEIDLESFQPKGGYDVYCSYNDGGISGDELYESRRFSDKDKDTGNNRFVILPDPGAGYHWELVHTGWNTNWNVYDGTSAVAWTSTESNIPLGVGVGVNGGTGISPTDSIKQESITRGEIYALGFIKTPNPKGTWGWWIDSNKNGAYDPDETHSIGNQPEGQDLELPPGRFQVAHIYRDGEWWPYSQGNDYGPDPLPTAEPYCPFTAIEPALGTYTHMPLGEAGAVIPENSKIRLDPNITARLALSDGAYGGDIRLGLVPLDGEFIVRYDLNGGVVPEDCPHNFEEQKATVNYSDYSSITIYKEKPRKTFGGEPLEFLGWEVQTDFDGGEEAKYVRETPINAGEEVKSKNPGILYLKAKWPETKFRVTYDLDGGYGDNSTQEAFVDGINWSEIETHKAPEKMGDDGKPLTFLGWMVMEDFPPLIVGSGDTEKEHTSDEHDDTIEYKAGDTINAGDIVKSKLPGVLPLKAQWSGKFRVEYDLNGGTGDDSPQEAEINNDEWVSFEAHEAPTMEVPGNTVVFMGWEVQKDFNAGEGITYLAGRKNFKEFEEIKSKNPGTLYLKAKWDVKPIPKNGDPIEYWGDGATEGEVEPETIPEDIKYYSNIVPLGHRDDMIEQLQKQVIDLKQDYGRGSLFDRILRSYEYNNLGDGNTGTPDSYDEQESKFKGWVWEGSSDTAIRKHLKDWKAMAWTGTETYYVEREITVDRTRQFCHHGCSVSYSATQIVYDEKRVYVTYLPGTQGWINHVFFDEAAIEQKEAEMKAKADQIKDVDRTIAYGDLNIPSCACYSYWVSTGKGTGYSVHVHRDNYGSYYSTKSSHLSQRSQYKSELNNLMSQRNTLTKTWNGTSIKFRARWEPNYDTTDFAEENGSLARLQVGNDRPVTMEGSGTNLGGDTTPYHQMGWYDKSNNGARAVGNTTSLTLGEGKYFTLERDGAYNTALPTSRGKRKDTNTLTTPAREAGKAAEVKGNANDPYIWYAHWYSVINYDLTTGLKDLFNGHTPYSVNLYSGGTKQYNNIITRIDPKVAGDTGITVTINDGKDRGYIGDGIGDAIDIIYKDDTCVKTLTRIPIVNYKDSSVESSLIFVGWNTRPDATGVWIGEYNDNGSDGKFTFTGPDITLYAQYRIDYTLIYNGNRQTKGPDIGHFDDALGIATGGDRLVTSNGAAGLVVNTVDTYPFRTNSSQTGDAYTNFERIELSELPYISSDGTLKYRKKSIAWNPADSLADAFASSIDTLVSGFFIRRGEMRLDKSMGSFSGLDGIQKQDNTMTGRTYSHYWNGELVPKFMHTIDDPTVYVEEEWNDNDEVWEGIRHPYAWQGWSLDIGNPADWDDDAYFNDNKVYHCPNILRTNVSTLTQVNPDGKKDIDEVSIYKYLVECLRYNPSDNIKVGRDKKISVITYAVWDQYPRIDSYYSISVGEDELDKGSLKTLIEERVKDYVTVSDREDSDAVNDYNGMKFVPTEKRWTGNPFEDKMLDVKVIGIDPDVLRNFKDDGTSSITCTIICIDSAGNISKRDVEIWVQRDKEGDPKEPNGHPSVDEDLNPLYLAYKGDRLRQIDKEAYTAAGLSEYLLTLKFRDITKVGTANTAQKSALLGSPFRADSDIDIRNVFGSDPLSLNPEAYGGLKDDSIWRKNSRYKIVLEAALDNTTDIKKSYTLTRQQRENTAEWIKQYGWGNTMKRKEIWKKQEDPLLEWYGNKDYVTVRK